MAQRIHRSSQLIFFGLILFAAMLTACSTSKPTIIISSPPSGSQFREGDEIVVQSVASDSAGIDRIELLVDGESVRTDSSPNPQVSFNVVQTWKATEGSHTITTRAYNKSGAVSDPAAISVNVTQGIAQITTMTPVPTLVATVTPPLLPPGTTTATTPTGSGACTNNAAFVSDVTIPDGMMIAAGQTYTKIWRISNTGSCVWTGGYTFIFVSGEAMTTKTVVAVPDTAPGASVDISVPMTAPTAGGSHTGQWRMRAANGTGFGTTVRVVITVPGVTPSATTPATSCSGTPVIASFTASAPSVPAATSITVAAGTTVTLNWGAVSNAESAELDQGIGGVVTPGTANVTPATTTIYTLTARCGGASAIRQVIVTIAAPAGNFAGAWFHNFGTLSITQSGSSVTGAYNNGFTGQSGTIAGTVTGNTLTGTYSIGGGSGSIQFILGGGSSTFDGNWNGTQKWCGAKAGVAFPAGCSFAGTWTPKIPSNPNCSMSLTRTDNTVSGSYCNGTVNGTVTYGSPTDTILTGTWQTGSSGALKFYLLGYGGIQFQGDYEPGAIDWCGWRGGASAPSPCGRTP